MLLLLRLTLLVVIMTMAAPAAIITGEIVTDTEGPLMTFGDGVHHVTWRWTVRGIGTMAWLYGSARTGDTDFAIARVTDVTEIASTAGLSFISNVDPWEGYLSLYPEDHRRFAVLHNIVSGHYGVIRVDGVYPNYPDMSPSFVGQWWFQTDGSANFATPEPDSFVLIGIGFIGLLLLKKRHRSSPITSPALLVMLMFISLSASAAPLTITFEGFQNDESILDFYNGGMGSGNWYGAPPSGPGPDHNLRFSSRMSVLIDSDSNGGTGSFANEPSPSTVMLTSMRDSGPAVLQVFGGFTGGFWFYYSRPGNNEVLPQIHIYSGDGATGAVLASIPLYSTAGNCTGDPSGGFCSWSFAGASFSGVARSISFNDVADYGILYDNLTFGGFNAVPEPSTVLLTSMSLLCLHAVRRRHRPKRQDN